MLDARNVKALYRKAQCLLAMNEPEDAKKIFEEVVDIEPGNKVRDSVIGDSEKLFELDIANPDNCQGRILRKL